MKRAAGLDDNDADIHRLLVGLNILTGDMAKALRHQERAVALNPNYDLVVVQMGEVLTCLGRAEEGIDWIKRAMRLNPHHPPRFWSHLGRAYFTARRYGEAIDAFKQMSSPDIVLHGFLAAAHAHLGEAETAKVHVAKIQELDPAFDLQAFLETMHYDDPDDLEHLHDGLAKAGLGVC